jgi:hypothetical protein
MDVSKIDFFVAIARATEGVVRYSSPYLYVEE